jgi:hypothetical protein
MSDYTPSRDGENVRITIPATFLAPSVGLSAAYRLTYALDEMGGPIGAVVLADHVVRVEPAPVELPTGFGARIRATTGGGQRVVLVRALGYEPVWLADFHETDDMDRQWYATADLSDVEILDAGEPS